jgi:hypothetical protein
VDRATAAAYTLVLHAALWLPITTLGIYYFFKARLHWSDFEKAAEAAEAAEEGIEPTLSDPTANSQNSLKKEEANK